MQDEFGLSPCTVPMQAIVFTRPVLLTEPASPSIGVASIFRRIVRCIIPISRTDLAVSVPKGDYLTTYNKSVVIPSLSAV